MIKTISIGESKFCVDTNGGKISEMILDGVKVLGTYNRIDGKKGSAHVCTPNFAGEGMETYGLPFHGPARTLEWEITKEDDKSIEMRVVLEALEKYESALEVRQVFEIFTRDLSTSLEMTHLTAFHHEVTVKNIGAAAVPVNIAIHNYFDTPHGWEGARINNKLINKEIKNNLPVPISVMVSLPNHDTMSPCSISHLEFGTSQSLLIETVGAHDIMCWACTKGGKYDSAYACVEPVVSCDPAYFESEASLLPPGETRNMSQKIYYKL